MLSDGAFSGRAASGTERFVYDGADVVRDLDGTNATVVEYLNGPRIDEQAASNHWRYELLFPC
jgi:hypothetical protein